MNDILFEALKAVVIIAILVITRYLIPALQSYISNSKYAWVSSVVKDAVESVEQTVKEEKSGSKKKAIVQTTVAQIFASAGITITQDQLNDLIESTVFAMNRDKKKAIRETVAQIFASAGIKITQDQLNDLIESAALATNHDK